MARRFAGSITRRTSLACSSESITVVTDRGTIRSRSASSVIRNGSADCAMRRSARSCAGVRPSGASWDICARRNRLVSRWSRSASCTDDSSLSISPV